MPWNESLRRMADEIRLEQSVKPRHVLGRVLDRIRWGEPFLLLETLRDSQGTVPVPGAFHLRGNLNGRFRWLALLFGEPGEAEGRLLTEARRRALELNQLAILRRQGAPPQRIAATPGAPLELTCAEERLEISGEGLLLRAVAAHEVNEGPYSLLALAARLRRGLPVGLEAIETR